MAYATVEQLVDRLGSTPRNASVLLDRASRDVDRVLMCSNYNTADSAVTTALQEATLEQVAWRLERGDVNGIEHTAQPGVPSGGAAGGVSLSGGGNAVGGSTYGSPRLGDQVWIILQQAGLTGQAPYTYLGG
jgi:hypothetical protein